MFSNQVSAFSKNLGNLRDFVDTVSAFLDEKQHQLMKDNVANLAPMLMAMNKLNPDEFEIDDIMIKKIEDRFGSKIQLEIVDGVEGEEKEVRIKLDHDGQKKFEEASSILETNQQRLKALYNNSLISLISSIELFLAQLIHKHYNENPGLVNSKDKQFSIEDLAKFDTINDARNSIIEKTIESVLRGSIAEWIEFFSSKLKLSMEYITEHKKYLIEAAQRRNLLIHNGGIVNRIYLSNYPMDLGEPPKIGNQLRVSYDYLSDTISRFERCFLLIAAELWKKVDKDNGDRGPFMIDLSFNHLLAERYDVAESLSQFTACDKSLKEVDQLYGKINYWISKKFGGDFESIRKDIEKEDFSAKSRIFILAKNVLLDKYEDAKSDIVYLIDHDDEFTFDKVKAWPLFKGFRGQCYYQDLIVKYEKNTKKSKCRKKNMAIDKAE